MQLVMSSRWSLMERFEITDESGEPLFEARGHLGSAITVHDAQGREVADIRKHVFSEVHEIYLGGQRVAQVRHAGFFGDHYDIATSYGPLTARGRFAGGDYTLSQNGVLVASMTRKFSLREKFAIDIADDANVAFLLAVMLAIEAIHDDRSDR
jgi:uncharacterized protein YxjI